MARVHVVSDVYPIGANCWYMRCLGQLTPAKTAGYKHVITNRSSTDWQNPGGRSSENPLRSDLENLNPKHQLVYEYIKERGSKSGVREKNPKPPLLDRASGIPPSSSSWWLRDINATRLIRPKVRICNLMRQLGSKQRTAQPWSCTLFRLWRTYPRLNTQD